MKSIRSTNPRLLVCLLGLSAASAACVQAAEPTATARSATVQCPPESPVLDLGDLPLTFVENQGQSPDEVQFQGLGLGAGTLAITAEGVRLDLADTPGGKAVPATSVLVRHDNATLALAPAAGAALSSTTTFITSGGTTSAAPNHGALAQEDLYPGIGVQLGGTLRKLVTTYTVAPGASADDIRFHYEGATDVSLDPGVGSITATVAGGARTLSLGPAQAHQEIDGKLVPVEASYVIGNGSIGIALGDHDPSAAVVIRTQLLHSRFFQAGGTTRANGQAYAVGRGYRATSSATDTGGDVYVAIVDEANGALAATTFLVGEGDDEGHAVAVATNGDILIAGQTRSFGFPVQEAIQPANAGGSDGFVARLDATGGSLIRSTYLGGAGDDAATGITETPAGSVLVASTSTKSREAVNAAAASFVTTLPAQGPKPVEVPYALTALGADLDSIAWVAPVRGSRIKRPRVWIDCNGLVRFGVRAPTAIDCTTLPGRQYEMAERGSNYTQDQQAPTLGWGFHALRWKYHLVNDPLRPGYTPTDLSWAPWGTSWFGNMPHDAPPNASGSLDDAFMLNDAEAAGFFTLAQTSTVVDPRGTWERGDHVTPETLAVKAALLEGLWHTPLYMTKVTYDPYGVASAHAMVVEGTDFNMCFDDAQAPPSGSPGIEDLCDMPPPGDWFGDVYCNSSGTQNLSFQILTFHASAWSEPLSPSFHQGVDLVPYPNGYQTQWWYEPGRFVFDPPAGEAQANAKLDEAADRLAGHVNAQAAMEQREIKGGAVTKTWTSTVVARASDLR